MKPDKIKLPLADFDEKKELGNHLPYIEGDEKSFARWFRKKLGKEWVDQLPIESQFADKNQHRRCAQRQG